jgi:hypothetical protein
MRFSRLVPAGLAALLVASASVGSAQAAPPDFLSDPEYRDLAAAAMYTSGLTYNWGGVVSTASVTSPYYSYTSKVEVGFNDYSQDFGVRLVEESSDGVMAPQQADGSLVGTLPGLGSVLDKAGLLPRPRPHGNADNDDSVTDIPNNKYEMWFGFNFGWGEFMKLDRNNAVERKALRLLGVPKATFAVGWPGAPYETGGQADAVMTVFNATTPASILAAISGAVADSPQAASVGDVTVEAGGNGSAVYSVPLIDAVPSGTVVFAFTVNSQGVVVNVTYAFDDGGFSFSVENDLVAWAKEDPVIAQPNPNATVVDRAELTTAVRYLYLEGDMRSAAQMVANEANSIATVANVKVSPALIQRAAKNLLPQNSVVKVSNIRQGVVLTLVDFPRGAKCRVTAEKKKGEWRAINRCVTPKNFTIPQGPR